MSKKITAAITAVSGYVPEDKLTNFDLEKIVDTTDEWIRSRTGIEERRILKGEGKGISEMIVPAVKQLCEKRGIDPMEIDCLIVGTVTPDMVFPATANIVCDKIGARNAWGFDVSAACSGFLYTLTVGTSLIESGRYKKVVVVGADKMSAIIDYSDRTTCIIFGDGAGAVLLEPNEEGLGIQDSLLRSDGSGCQYLRMKAGGSAYPATAETVANREHYVYQEGQAVFKFAVKGMADISAELLERNNLTGDDISWLVPHQANLRIIDATANRIGLPKEKVMINIQKYGNTTAATIPLCLWEWEKQLKKGDNIVLAAFGGGFTWGATLVKWAY
ncbi:MAG: 3-oxoacyl-ACP synthase [Sphingobacteriales bacterium SCN 48-20]|jgi:3-oxoacyl-[acyl-carrier-protein] synthase-3|uniref:beta-ketoacyl-ACP synthase III n=1 Tax=Terrimonas ferruginea TaxID=249 RepID=UPI00086A5A45|nr:beta-ketoacyl-ACP synthase III [Terrimonas ferruginea]MBN8781630.1 ketoacyl-ACP synthase III [Terrimonas ferruginea]ODT94000.1 MAG: 3-oxoacyl-ACP synthase [Sphingobacteriales bacterium SCN 48-20]OJW44790.1 MAG: 3-oxoacyl-ACP synthase [Sphingobacteriales bacterium 48-107]